MRIFPWLISKTTEDFHITLFLILGVFLQRLGFALRYLPTDALMTFLDKMSKVSYS